MKEAHFVINDEEEEIPISKKEGEKKEGAPGETYDDSSDEEEKKEKQFAEAIQ